MANRKLQAHDASDRLGNYTINFKKWKVNSVITYNKLYQSHKNKSKKKKNNGNQFHPNWNILFLENKVLHTDSQKLLRAQIRTSRIYRSLNLPSIWQNIEWINTSIHNERDTRQHNCFRYFAFSTALNATKNGGLDYNNFMKSYHAINNQSLKK